MHILGKVLIGLVIVAGCAAVVLTAELHQVRNSWTEQAAKLEAENEKNADNLVKQRAQLALVRGQLDRAMLGWDRYWKDVDVQVLSQAEGTVQIHPLGSDNGLIVPSGPTKPLVHLFRSTGNGYEFVGPFLATTVTGDRSAFAPRWKPRSGQTKSWSEESDANKWRVRSMIPSHHSSQFAHLQNSLRTADQRLEDRNRNLEIQKELVEKANHNLGLRHMELLGDEEAEPIEGRPELTEGLIKAIASAEENRNAAFAEVDRLRRQVNDGRKKMDALVSKNKNLVLSLPSPSTQVSKQD